MSNWPSVISPSCQCFPHWHSLYSIHLPQAAAAPSSVAVGLVWKWWNLHLKSQPLSITVPFSFSYYIFSCSNGSPYPFSRSLPWEDAESVENPHKDRIFVKHTPVKTVYFGLSEFKLSFTARKFADNHSLPSLPIFSTKGFKFFPLNLLSWVPLRNLSLHGEDVLHDNPLELWAQG